MSHVYVTVYVYVCMSVIAHKYVWNGLYVCLCMQMCPFVLVKNVPLILIRALMQSWVDRLPQRNAMCIKVTKKR